jgi:dihydroxyacetone kinase-like protein
MTGTWNTDSIRHGISQIAMAIEGSADALNRLDGALGDGDLGVTMLRGVRGLVDVAPELPEDVGKALFRCAQVFTKVSGSTYGTLLATGLMAAAKATRGRTEVPWSEVSALLGSALSEMSRRGRAELGDKTVLDAVAAARAATEGMEDPDAMAQAADKAVADALDRFRDEPSQQGRARIFGEKSIGLDDPGMVAFKRMTEALAN